MPTAVETSIDVAFWLLDQALDSNEYLQPQKLHRLLFLSQAYFAVVNKGRKLMPAVFVADEMGPIEPNLYRAFANGRPNIEAKLTMAPDVEEYLKNIWARFGHHSVDHLNRICKRNLAYVTAFKRAPGGEISMNAMVKAFTRDEVPAVGQVVRPKILRTQDGQSVAISAWLPKGSGPQKAPKAKPQQKGKSQQKVKRGAKANLVQTVKAVGNGKPAGRAALIAKAQEIRRTRGGADGPNSPMIVGSTKKPLSAKQRLIEEALKKRGR